jgi:hypothetical protein
VSRRPKLTPEDLADPSKLGGILDAVVADDNYRKLTAKILKAQDRLQQLASDDAWVEYLEVEQLVNTRMTFMLTAVAKFAFNEGRRHQRQLRHSR